MDNTAVGVAALFSSTAGVDNTAIGFAALESAGGCDNTAVGSNALRSNTGTANTALGEAAGTALTRGNGNILLGDAAGYNLTTGDYNIDIGNIGVAGDANTIRIGTAGTQTGTFVAGIFGSTIPSGVGVMVNSSGKVGTVLSSERFKEAIKPMDKASEPLLSLQPVTFRYKHELDPEGRPQFGLVAEQVEKVNPDLVARDEKGQVYTVRYEAVNAMLLNEFLKEHKKVAEQQATIAELKASSAKQAATVAQQQKQIEALTAGLQKVSAAVELNKPAPIQVTDNH